MYHHHRRVVIVPLLSSATNDNHDIVSRQYYCFATAYPATSPLYFSKEEDQKMACKYVHIPFIIPAVSFAAAAAVAVDDGDQCYYYYCYYYYYYRLYIY